MTGLALKSFIFKQTYTRLYLMEKQEDVLRKERKRSEGANNREVDHFNLKLCGLALRHVNQRLSH